MLATLLNICQGVHCPVKLQTQQSMLEMGCYLSKYNYFITFLEEGISIETDRSLLTDKAELISSTIETPHSTLTTHVLT